MAFGSTGSSADAVELYRAMPRLIRAGSQSGASRAASSNSRDASEYANCSISPTPRAFASVAPNGSGFTRTPATRSRTNNPTPPAKTTARPTTSQRRDRPEETTG